jgi:hypothetical protein
MRYVSLSQTLSRLAISLTISGLKWPRSSALDALRIRPQTLRLSKRLEADGHQEAIERLRAYTPPPTHYFSLPLSRRAAVLLLLYADRNGKLRVVLTMRAKTLSSCTSPSNLAPQG